MQIWNKKKTKLEILKDDLDLSSPDDETGNESDNETEFGNDEWFAEI